MKKILILPICFLLLLSCTDSNDNSIKIEWIDGLEEGFDFTEQWEYPEGIYRNDYGQLICDGICPPEIEGFADSNGKIPEDSLSLYYQFVDTTHTYFTFEGISNLYQLTNIKHAVAYEDKNDTVKCYTRCNASIHSFLEMKIIGDKCYPQLIILSITNEETEYLPCTGDFIKIDKPLFEKGILKAQFLFDFTNNEDPETPIWWKGLIYTKINKPENVDHIIQ